MLRRFPSIAHTDHAYAFDSDAWTSQAQVNTNFRMYQTYGDGLTQHSSDWPITIEHMPDYLMSLAQAMLSDAELTERLSYRLARSPRPEDIEFCAGVVFKPQSEGSTYEKKTRYYSVSERKVTSNPEKQHDKRYQQVENSHDGSPNAIYRMLLPEYAHALEAYQFAAAVHKYWLSLPSSHPFYMEMPALFLEWTKDRDEARSFRDSFDAALAVVESSRLRSSAENDIENAIRRATARKEAKENAVQVA